MKILQCHNSYLYPGGEDTATAAESAMFRHYGHDVLEYRRFNKDIGGLTIGSKLKFYLNDIYFSKAVYNDMRALIRNERPAVAHFHNSFFLIGPAGYQACIDAQVPVVQTLHNYRFLCAAGTFFRDGKVCEACLVHGRGAGITHRCWHGSAPATFVMTRVIEQYARRGILDKISRFIALSAFSREKYIQAGWDGSRIGVEPNFLDQDPGCRKSCGKFVLYVGALQSYKGVATLLKAWGLKSRQAVLKIAGAGPLEAQLRGQATGNVEWLGQVDFNSIAALMKESRCVVLPSECYENFPRVIIEAYACGVPVIASRLGALPEIVRNNVTGYLFSPGDAGELSARLDHLLENPDLSSVMGGNARRIFEENYTQEAHYRRMIDIYEQAAK